MMTYREHRHERPNLLSTCAILLEVEAESARIHCGRARGSSVRLRVGDIDSVLEMAQEECPVVLEVQRGSHALQTALPEVCGTYVGNERGAKEDKGRDARC